MPLALHEERLERRRLEWCRRALDDGNAGYEFARLGLGHQAGSEVHRVAHHRVHPTPRRSDLAREHMTRVDPNAHRESDVGVEQRAPDSEHPTLAVLDGVRHACGEDHLDAPAGNVGRKEAHLVTAGDLERHADESVQALGDHLGSGFSQHAIHTADVDEADSDVAVLGAVIVVEQSAPQGSRDERGERLVVALIQTVRRDEAG